MKKTLLNLALVATLASVSAQGISTVAAFDDFMDGNKANPGVDPYAVEDKDHFAWDTLANAPSTTKKAYKGIYWWVKAAKGLDFSWKRAGDGVLAYSINQAEGAYEPFGVGFGQYAESASATKSSFYTLDLTNNANVELKFKNLSGSPLKITLQLQDVDSTTIGYDVANAADAPGNLYMYDIKKELTDGSVTAEQTLSFDFANATGSEYVFNSESAYGCKDKAVLKDKATTGFKYDKVKAVVITVTNYAQLGADKCYGREAVSITDGKFVITSLKIGDQTTVVGVSDEIIANFKDEVVTVYNFSGAYVAQGNVADLNLTPGFYIFKSASKAVKTFVK